MFRLHSHLHTGDYYVFPRFHKSLLNMFIGTITNLGFQQVPNTSIRSEKQLHLGAKSWAGILVTSRVLKYYKCTDHCQRDILLYYILEYYLYFIYKECNIYRIYRLQNYILYLYQQYIPHHSVSKITISLSERFYHNSIYQYIFDNVYISIKTICNTYSVQIIDIYIYSLFQLGLNDTLLSDVKFS